MVTRNNQIWPAVEFLMNQILIITVVPKYLNFSTFSDDLLLTLCYDFALYSSDDTSRYT
jgi:hypothetical protein